MKEINKSNTGLSDKQENSLREGVKELLASLSIENVNILQFKF